MKGEYWFLSAVILFGLVIRSPLYYLMTQGRWFFEYYFVGNCPVLYGVDSYFWLGKGISLCILGYYPLVAFTLSCIFFFFGIRKLVGRKSGLLTTLFFATQIDIWRNTFLGLGDSNGLFLLGGCVAFFLISHGLRVTAGLLSVGFLFLYNPRWIQTLWGYVFGSGMGVQELQRYPDFFVLHLLWFPILLCLLWCLKKKKVQKILLIGLFLGVTVLVINTYRFNWLFGLVYCVYVGYFFKSVLVKFDWPDRGYSWVPSAVMVCFLLLFVFLTFGRYFPGEPFITAQTYEELGSSEKGIYLGFWSKAHIVCGISGGVCRTGAFPNDIDSMLLNAIAKNDIIEFSNVVDRSDADYYFMWDDEIISPLALSVWEGRVDWLRFVGGSENVRVFSVVGGGIETFK